MPSLKGKNQLVDLTRLVWNDSWVNRNSGCHTQTLPSSALNRLPGTIPTNEGDTVNYLENIPIPTYCILHLWDPLRVHAWKSQGKTVSESVGSSHPELLPSAENHSQKFQARSKSALKLMLPEYYGYPTVAWIFTRKNEHKATCHTKTQLQFVRISTTPKSFDSR